VADARVIGIDLGGTKILAGVLDRQGKLDSLVERSTPVSSQEALLDALVQTVRELRGPDIAAVGFGVPARIDQRTGLVLGAVNTPLQDIRLVDVLAERLEMVIVEGGEPCQGACTGHGHVESYCSGRAADRLAQATLGPPATARDLVELRHPALAEIGRHLGSAIASLVNLFDPDMVVVGGGFGVAAGEQLLGPAREVLLTEALAPAGERVQLSVAELGSKAGVIGAALIAFETLE
jgi:predicted NBD/HSP70 family sugar kinase